MAFIILRNGALAFPFFSVSSWRRRSLPPCHNTNLASYRWCRLVVTSAGRGRQKPHLHWLEESGVSENIDGTNLSQSYFVSWRWPHNMAPATAVISRMPWLGRPVVDLQGLPYFPQ